MLRDEVLSIAKGEAMPLRAVLETKRELLKLHLPGEFLFVLRIRFGVMSVLCTGIFPPDHPLLRSHADVAILLSHRRRQSPLR